MPAYKPPLSEHDARNIVLVQAIEEGDTATAWWTVEDRAWATSLARATATAQANIGDRTASFVTARARHAVQRLQARAPAIARALGQRLWRAQWYALAAVLGLVAGALTEQIGAGQRINLLAPPLWGVVGWNLMVYLWWLSRLLRLRMAPWLDLLSPRRALVRQCLGREPARTATPEMAAFQAQWIRHAAPINLARAAGLLHIASAALALGLMLGLYTRGLVFDFRAGWQSTFLDATQVQALLNLLLDPASRLSGIAVPQVATLRIAPDAAATGLAAPWIHLYATTLLSLVVLPRALLAAASVWRARRLSRRFPLPWHEPYFAQLARAREGAAACVQIFPHGAAPDAQVMQSLRVLVALEFGDDVQLQIEQVTAYGDEDSPPARVAGATAVALFDLAATPEADIHGRFITALKETGPTLVAVDEAAFQARFAHLPERLAQRRETWRAFCHAHGARWLGARVRG